MEIPKYSFKNETDNQDRLKGEVLYICFRVGQWILVIFNKKLYQFIFLCMVHLE